MVINNLIFKFCIIVIICLVYFIIVKILLWFTLDKHYNGKAEDEFKSLSEFEKLQLRRCELLHEYDILDELKDKFRKREFQQYY